jgi:hypothetical protein
VTVLILKVHRSLWRRQCTPTESFNVNPPSSVVPHTVQYSTSALTMTHRIMGQVREESFAAIGLRVRPAVQDVIVSYQLH